MYVGVCCMHWISLFQCSVIQQPCVCCRLYCVNVNRWCSFSSCLLIQWLTISRHNVKGVGLWRSNHTTLSYIYIYTLYFELCIYTVYVLRKKKVSRCDVLIWKMTGHLWSELSWATSYSSLTSMSWLPLNIQTTFGSDRDSLWSWSVWSSRTRAFLLLRGIHWWVHRRMRGRVGAFLPPSFFPFF